MGSEMCIRDSSNSVAPFKIDTDTGRLTYVRGSKFVPHPICVLFTDGGQ